VGVLASAKEVSTTTITYVVSRQVSKRKETERKSVIVEEALKMHEMNARSTGRGMEPKPHTPASMDHSRILQPGGPAECRGWAQVL
jgi:hypothetical protein